MSNEDLEESVDPVDVGDMTADDLERHISGLGADQPEESDVSADSESDTTDNEPNTQSVSDTGAAEDGGEGEEQAAEPQGVATADGKNVIPYEVLKRTRWKVADLSGQVGDLTRQLQEANTRLAQVQQGGSAEEQAAASGARQLSDMISKEQLEELRATAEEDPAMAALLKGFESLSATVGEMRQTEEQRTADARRSEEEAQRDAESAYYATVQQAIDANPTVAAWQASNDQTAFNFADQLHRQLSTANAPDPESGTPFTQLPLGDQLAIVQHATETALRLPSSKHSSDTVNDETPTGNAPAGSKTEGAEEKPPGPFSITDLGGGTPRQEAPSINFDVATPEQIEAYMNSLG